MDFTGERYVPAVAGQIKYEHLHRYALSLELVAGKSVLDIASGEGGREFMRGRHGGDVVFDRFSRVLAQIMNPVSIQPIFFEEMQFGGSSRFDYELDNMVKQKAVQQGRVKGFCNVSGRSTEFVVSSDTLASLVEEMVEYDIRRHRGEVQD